MTPSTYVDPAVSAVADAAYRCTTVGPDGVVTAWRSWPGTDRDSDVTLVLLHGSYGSWTHWMRNILALRRRCTVVCPDIPGFGESGDVPAQHAPDDIGRTLAAALLAWRTQANLPVERWCIAGFSLGSVYAGWLARFLADFRGETVERLALVSPGGLGPREGRDLGMRRVPADSDADRQWAIHRHNLEAVMFGRADLIDDTAIRIQRDNVAKARFRGPFAPSPDFLLRALSGTRWPVLGLWGQRDAFDVDIGVRCDALRSVRPDASSLVVAGAGHWLPYEAADEVNTALINWFDQ